MAEDLDSLNLDELRRRASEANIEGRSSMNKEDLVRALRESTGDHTQDRPAQGVVHHAPGQEPQAGTEGGNQPDGEPAPDPASQQSAEGFREQTGQDPAAGQEGQPTT